MKKLTAAQQRLFDNAVLIAALQLIFASLEKFGVPIYPLGKVANTTSGGTPDRGVSEYYGGNIPWIKSGELNDGLIGESEEYITDAGLQNSSAKVYPKGTLVVALYGATVGKTGILAINAASNQAVCAITPTTNRISISFLFWFLRYKRPDFLKGSFGAAQPNISQKVLRETLLPVPAIDHQREICNFLEVVEQRQKGKKDLLLPNLPFPLSNLKNVVARIEELATRIEEARGLRREAVEEAKALFTSAINEAWSDQSNWVVRPVKDLITLVSGQIDPTIEPYASLPHINGEAIESGTCRLLTYRTAKDDGVTSGKYHFKAGSILYSKIRPYLRKAVQVPVEGVCSADVYAIESINPVLDPRFFMYSLIAPKFTSYANALSGRTRMPKLNQDQLLSFQMGYPPLSEQRYIVNYLDNLQMKISVLKQLQSETSAELDALLPSILDKAFKGEL